MVAGQCLHFASPPLNLSAYVHSQLDQQTCCNVNSHAMRLLRKLGEGGYAFVYLVQEVPSSTHTSVDSDTRYALKKVLASSQERLEAAQREATIHQQACHPCILPLLDWAVVPPQPSEPHASHTVYLLSPAYTDGTLADELARLGSGRAKACTNGTTQQVQQQESQCVLSTQQVLSVFQQLCLALDSLHNTGYAHRDVKVHNILIRRPSCLSGKQPSETGHHAISIAPDSPPAAPATPAPHPFASVAHAYGTRHAMAAHNASASLSAVVNDPQTPRAAGAATSPVFTLPTHSSAPMATGAPIDAKDVLAAGIARRSGGGSSGDGLTGSGGDALGGGSWVRSQHYRAVLMDFGSAGPRRVHVRTRGEALIMQEDAEANCTATFRAPELWDCPSPCTLDQGAADVWAAGCTLYAAMYGQSPFQISLNQGGSLALAVLNTSLPWPRDPACHYPQPLHDLVTSCLAPDPAQRPSAGVLAAAAGEMMVAQPPLPDPPMYARNPPYTWDS